MCAAVTVVMSLPMILSCVQMSLCAKTTDPTEHRDRNKIEGRKSGRGSKGNKNLAPLVINNARGETLVYPGRHKGARAARGESFRRVTTALYPRRARRQNTCTARKDNGKAPQNQHEHELCRGGNKTKQRNRRHKCGPPNSA